VVSDSGTHTDVTTLVPKTGQPRLIEITVTCTGKQGSFSFVGKVPRADRITKATGAYTALVGAVTTSDLSLTSNPLEPGAPGAPKPTLNAVRVIDVFKRG
jgi:hypothetical protein